VDIGGKAKWMFFDQRALLLTPGGSGGDDTISEEAIDAAIQKVLQVLEVVGDPDDQFAISATNLLTRSSA
jgi:hypothetical protein